MTYHQIQTAVLERGACLNFVIVSNRRLTCDFNLGKLFFFVHRALKGHRNMALVMSGYITAKSRSAPH